MLHLTSLIIVLFIGISSFAEESHWTDSYQLTEIQVNHILKWEKAQKFTHEKLVSMAESYEKFNLRPKPYVPPHTFSELVAVTAWGEGLAFPVFAELAGYTFDTEAFKEACPSLLLFNFGYATGTAYFQIDVLSGYSRTFSSLQFMYSLHPETFAQKFFDLAKARGFDIYLSPIEKVASL